MRQVQNNWQNRGSFRLILRVICITGFLCCAAWLVWYLFSLRNSNARIEEVREDYVSTLEPIEMSEPTEAPEPEITPEPNLFGGREYLDLTDMDVPELEIDFAGLQEINPDIYAWLHVPGTDIDHPILQRDGEAEYYLRRDIEGNSSTAGCIFTQYYNSKDWTDNHTVVYGHNMRDGSMFATLHNYEDSQFFEKHPYIYVFTPEYTLVYQVFGAYRYPDVHLLKGFMTNDHDSFQQYLDGVLAQDGMDTNFNRSLDVTADDRIITLSTCMSTQGENRYLVQGKLIAVGKAAETGETADDGEMAGTAAAGTNG